MQGCGKVAAKPTGFACASKSKPDLARPTGEARGLEQSAAVETRGTERVSTPSLQGNTRAVASEAFTLPLVLRSLIPPVFLLLSALSLSSSTFPLLVQE